MTQPDNQAQAAPAVLRMTIGITRKATGVTETFELVSDPMPAEQAQQIVEAQKSTINTQPREES